MIIITPNVWIIKTPKLKNNSRLLVTQRSRPTRQTPPLVSQVWFRWSPIHWYSKMVWTRQTAVRVQLSQLTMADSWRFQTNRIGCHLSVFDWDFRRARVAGKESSRPSHGDKHLWRCIRRNKVNKRFVLRQGIRKQIENCLVKSEAKVRLPEQLHKGTEHLFGVFNICGLHDSGIRVPLRS